MKKVLLSALLILGINACFAYSLNGFSERFIRKFQNCEPYIENSAFNKNGTVYRDKKQIEGWYGDYCAYKQVTKFAGITLYTTCAFSKSQVNDLYKALLIQPKSFGFDNKTQEIWDKFVLDKNNCHLSGQNIFGKGIQVEPKYIPDFKDFRPHNGL